MRVPSQAQLKVIQDEDAIAQTVCGQLSASQLAAASTPICKAIGRRFAATLLLSTGRQGSEQDLTMPEARTEAASEHYTIEKIRRSRSGWAGLIVIVGLSGPLLKRAVDWLVPSLFHEEHPELAQAAVEPIVVPVVKEAAERVEARGQTRKRQMITDKQKLPIHLQPDAVAMEMFAELDQKFFAGQFAAEGGWRVWVLDWLTIIGTYANLYDGERHRSIVSVA